MSEVLLETKTFVPRQEPVTAIKLTRENLTEVAKWCGGMEIYDTKSSDPTDVYQAIDVPTLEGARRANIGDYVVRSVMGRFYPLHAFTFDRRYQEVIPDGTL